MYSVIDQWIATGEAKGIKIGEANGENRMAEKVQRNIQTLLENRQITEETAALLRSITL